jgi:hypothetical protein
MSRAKEKGQVERLRISEEKGKVERIRIKEEKERLRIAYEENNVKRFSGE